MNKNLLAILITLLILLIGSSAVSAIDNNSTDEVMSFEQNEANQTNINTVEVLIEENNNEIMSAQNNNYDVFSAENNNDEIMASVDESCNVLSLKNDSNAFTTDNSNGVLSVETNYNEIITVKDNTDNIFTSKINENEKLSITPYTGPDPTEVYMYDNTGHYLLKHQIFLIAKMKIHKKYWKMLIHEKKRTKKFKKMYKSKLKSLKKTMKKKLKKLAKQGWKGSRTESYDDILVKGNYYVFYYYGDFYKKFYYN